MVTLPGDGGTDSSPFASRKVAERLSSGCVWGIEGCDGVYPIGQVIFREDFGG